MPPGWFSGFKDQHAQLRKACGKSSDDKGHRRIYALYLRALRQVAQQRPGSAVTEYTPPSNAPSSAVVEASPFAKFRYKTPRLGQQYFDSKLVIVKREADRRRVRGAGRHKSASVLRCMLMEWYSVIRHSVNTKIMVRFPKKTLMVKAQMLQRDYYANCLRNGTRPEIVDITGRWLNRLLAEYRVTQRMPNRKYKVRRAVLAERMLLMWISAARVR